jgi:hypothetical protein
MKKSAGVVVGTVLTYLLSAPVVAVGVVILVAATLLPSTPANVGWAAVAAVFLGVIPLAGYVLPALVRRTAGNERVQRLVSFLVNLVSYPVGAVILLIGQAPPVLSAIAWSYVATVAALALVNLFYKASGHASGVAGPVVAFFMLYGAWALPSLLLLPLVVWARVKVKGHTWPQTVAGALIAAVATWGVFACVL